MAYFYRAWGGAWPPRSPGSATGFTKIILLFHTKAIKNDNIWLVDLQINYQKPVKRQERRSHGTQNVKRDVLTAHLGTFVPFI